MYDCVCSYVAVHVPSVLSSQLTFAVVDIFLNNTQLPVYTGSMRAGLICAKYTTNVTPKMSRDGRFEREGPPLAIISWSDHIVKYKRMIGSVYTIIRYVRIGRPKATSAFHKRIRIKIYIGGKNCLLHVLVNKLRRVAEAR